MALLTPGEFEDLPEDVKQQLAAIQQQPRSDMKSTDYGRRFGRTANGQRSTTDRALSCWEWEATS